MRHVAAEVVLSRTEAVVDVCAFIAGASNRGRVVAVACAAGGAVCAIACAAGGAVCAIGRVASVGVDIADAVVLGRAEAVVDVGAVVA